MNKEQAIAELKKQQVNEDTESAHGIADEVLCELLVALDHQEVVEQFYKIKKWYA